MKMRACLALAALLYALLPGHSSAAPAQPVDIPILVPLSGFLAFEGQSQRNGALLAMQEASGTVAMRHEVADTGDSPAVAVNALQRALEDKPIAVIASMLGTQMLAMLPIAEENKVPLVTISGTAKITELGNPWVFRFFPGDNVVKVAHARYVVEVLGAKHPAIIYQSDAYGQSGQHYLAEEFAALGVTPVLSEAVDVSVKDLLPVLSKAKAAGADVIVSHLHVPSSALLVKQAASSGLGLPIVSGSAIATPSTAALLELGELKGVCAESSAAPIVPDSSGGRALPRVISQGFQHRSRRLCARPVRRHEDAARRHRGGCPHAGGRARRARRRQLQGHRHDLPIGRRRQHGPFRDHPVL